MSPESPLATPAPKPSKIAWCGTGEGDTRRTPLCSRHNHVLWKHTRHQQFTLYPAKGQYNIIEVDGERIRDKEDNSPDQIAVHTGWISRIGQQSICLPHKLLIEIKPAQGNHGSNGDAGRLVHP